MIELLQRLFELNDRRAYQYKLLKDALPFLNVIVPVDLHDIKVSLDADLMIEFLDLHSIKVSITLESTLQLESTDLSTESTVRDGIKVY